MRAFTACELTDNEFDVIAQHHPNANFQQTLHAATLRRMQGTHVLYPAVKEHHTVVAAALMEVHRSRFGTFCVIHDGPLCDFEDAELVHFFTGVLQRAARSQGADQLSITPETPYRLRHSDGSENGDARHDIITNLTSCGWIHEGFTTGYTAVPRWRYVKDLTGFHNEAELLASYSKRTQWSVKRSQSMGVVVREISTNELQTFADIEQGTAERRHFAYRGLRYFQQFKEAYGADAHFLVAYIDTRAYCDAMSNKHAALEHTVQNLQTRLDTRPTTRIQRRLGEEQRNLEASAKRLAEAETLLNRGRTIPAAASLFVTNPHEVVYLFSGSVEEYKPFYASALIQHVAMTHLCLDQGIDRYNFYGIDGIFNDPNDEGRGVLEFKQGYCGYVEELPGEFTLPIHPIRYAIKRRVRGMLEHTPHA